MQKALRLLVGLVLVLVLVLAACGGDSDEQAASPTTTAGADDATTTTTTSPAPTTTAAPVAAPSGDFCEFVVAYAAETDFSVVGLNPAELEELFTSNVDAMNQAVALAPAEVKGDVMMFADAYGGFVELLAEVEFNYLAMASIDQDDPRLAALADPELEAAGDRIEAHCGIDEFIATAPVPPGDPGGSAPGGGGAVTGTDLPQDFPTELVPEGAEVLVVLDVQGVDSITYDVSLPADEVVEFYEGLLGPATAELSDPRGALWIGEYDGSSINVTVAETDPATTQVNVTFG